MKWNLSNKSTAAIMRDEEREIDASIPAHDPPTASREDVERIAARLTTLTPQILAMKDASEVWLRQAKSAAYRGRGYQDRELFEAHERRAVWGKRTHQELLRITANWTRELRARKLDAPAVKPEAGERPDLGAVVIERAYRYRYHRTKDNGAALDAALDVLAAASERWRTFRDGLD